MILAAMIALVMAPSLARAQVGGGPLVVTTMLDGQLATLDCGADAAAAPFALAAARIAAEPGALVLDAGGLIGASALSRAAVARDGAAVALAIAAAGYRALAVDHRDLATPTLMAIAAELASHHVPYVLTNLSCAPERREVCAAIIDAGDPPLLLPGPGGPTAFLAVVAPVWLSRVSRDRAAGLALAEPSVALAPAIRAARAAGARRVVVSFDSDRPSPVEQALALAAALPDDARADVILASRLPPGVASLQLDRGGLLVAARAAHPVVIESDEDGHGHRHGARPARAAPPSSAPPSVLALAADLRGHLCTTMQRPLVGARLGHAVDRDGLALLLLDVLRERTRAEVGFINRTALRALPVFPVEDGRLTELIVRAALPYEDVSRTARIKGADLRALVTSASAADLHVRGVTGHGADARVNGRKLDDGAVYSVVTTGFLAEGGDPGIADKLSLRPEFGPNLVRALLDWLATAPDGAVDADRSAVSRVVHRPIDPADLTRWTIRGALDTAFTSVNITNAAQYTDPQLSRAESTALRFDVDLGADAERPDFLFYNQLRATWAVQRTVSTSGGTTKDSGFVEIADLISARSLFVLRPEPLRHPYLPVPFAEVYAETEVRPPPSRSWHHLELRPAVGLRFLLVDRFSLYAGYSLDVDFFRPTTPFAPAWLLGWSLVNGPLFRVGGRAIEAQSSFDAIYRDPSIHPEVMLRFSARILVPIFSVLSLTVGYDLFARKSADAPWGAAGSLLVGLHIGASRAFQSFRF